MIDGEPALLDILDTAGQEGILYAVLSSRCFFFFYSEYASLQDQWIREGDGYLIVYSIISDGTLDAAQVLLDKIIRIRDTENFPVVLAGNKCDLESDRQIGKGRLFQEF